MSRLDGGSAFPHDYTERLESGLQAGHTTPRTYSVHGMTLRDYFAAQAIQRGMLHIAEGDAALMAACAYEMADAMLAERDK